MWWLHCAISCQCLSSGRVRYFFVAPQPWVIMGDKKVDKYFFWFQEQPKQEVRQVNQCSFAQSDGNHSILWLSMHLIIFGYSFLYLQNWLAIFWLLEAFFLSFPITTCFHSNDHATQVTLTEHDQDTTVCTMWLHVWGHYCAIHCSMFNIAFTI